jgi:hypothetical protein
MSVDKNETRAITLSVALGLVSMIALALALGMELEQIQRLLWWLVKVAGLTLGLALALALALGLMTTLGLSVGVVLGQVLGLIQSFLKQSSSTSKLNRLFCVFPEEQRNDVTTKLRRLKKAKKPQWFIWLKAFQYWRELFGVAIQIWWDNLWLPRNRNINK